VIGAVLAGGAGSRLGAASKAMAPLAGRPLIAYPLDAMGEVCAAVAVVCKRDTALPPLPDGVERWDEPDEPRHPLTGIIHALERAQTDVLVCAADMPFVTGDALRLLLAVREEGAAVVATNEGTLTPVLALYHPSALPQLREATEGEALKRTVERLNPATVELSEATSVNTPEDLRAAGSRLAGR
jgi:molybdenum cofactor guanylyltransferase